jgi:hypothetical protein
MPETNDDGGLRRKVQFSIEQDRSGVDVLVHFPNQPESPEADQPLMQFSTRWREFSPLETEVLLSLGEAPLKTAAIAAAIGREANDSTLKVVLANLGARGILVTTQDGYRIDLDADKLANFLAWLRTV